VGEGKEDIEDWGGSIKSRDCHCIPEDAEEKAKIRLPMPSEEEGTK